jgi:putative oxidoreductase
MSGTPVEVTPRGAFTNDRTSATMVTVSRLLHSRYPSGPVAVVVALIRVVTGLVFVTVSTGKFADHAVESVDFGRYGVPIPDIAVYAVGVVELVCGLLLVAGLMTRPAAAALAATMVGAIATAGRVDGGSFHLGVAPTLLVVTLALLWVGSGRPAVDAILERRSNVASPV